VATEASTPTGFVHADPVSRALVERALRFARTNATILITGESGTGKEVLARMVHEHSSRRDQPYRTLNCAALSEHLFESELFGHEAGAFTGAVSQRRGWLESAANGTLLLDEISEIALPMQAKLLRVLQEGEFHRVGGNDVFRATARIIATSNRSLPHEVASGRFREDLYYRLQALHLQIPPLRDRPADVLPLLAHFVQRCAQEFEQPERTLSASARQLILAHAWPGNARELQHAILHAYAISDAPDVQPEHLPDLTAVRRPESSTTPMGAFADLSMAQIERRVILWNMERFHQNKTAVARHLGLTPKTIAAKLKDYASYES
jgi:DNA-binding NtrC family response regulator